MHGEHMLLNTKTLFELSVYRLDKESYYRDFLKYKNINATEYIPDSSLINDYGGQWEYSKRTNNSILAASATSMVGVLIYI